MIFAPLEIIALIVVILSLIKLIFILINKEVWYKKVAKPIYSESKASAVIFILLALIVFYFLIQELTITQIFASLAFASLLIGIGFLAYGKEMQSLIEKIYKNKLTPWQFLYIIIWLLLSIWVLYDILK